MESTTRRKFIKGALALGGLLTTSGCMKATQKPSEWISGAPDVDPVDGKNVKIVRTVCLGCHSACGLQCKAVDGALAKVSGNPYHPATNEPHIPYETDPKAAEKLEGTACAKAGATIQTLYNPGRIMHPLKRVGPRGSGKWKTVTWEQAYDEIINGGDLFGEGNVDGLAACRDLTTPADPDAPEAKRSLRTAGLKTHTVPSTIVWIIPPSVKHRITLAWTFVSAAAITSSRIS